MKLRHKTKGYLCSSHEFNISTCCPQEIIITGDDVGRDTDFLRDYDVLIRGAWKDLANAFQDGDIVVDDYNHYFYEKDDYNAT